MTPTSLTGPQDIGIDHGGGNFAGQNRQHAIGGGNRHATDRMMTQAPDMGGANQIWHVLDDARRRFVFKYVEGSAGDCASAQRLEQGGRVDQRSARGVHQKRRRLHLR